MPFHITEVFFQEELAHTSGRIQPKLSYIPRSRVCCVTRVRSQAPQQQPAAEGSEESDHLLNQRDVEELGERMGLLFTDATHTVLSDLRVRPKSLLR